ncbi:hypothetical protein ACFLS1_07385 [Verrucomicrobiota bacterium]
MRLRGRKKIEMVNLGQQPILDAARQAKPKDESATGYLIWGILELCWIVPVVGFLVFVRPVICIFRLFHDGHYLWSSVFFAPFILFWVFAIRDLKKHKVSKATVICFALSFASLAGLSLAVPEVSVWFWD